MECDGCVYVDSISRCLDCRRFYKDKPDDLEDLYSEEEEQFRRLFGAIMDE
jgi:hypothetical protein